MPKETWFEAATCTGDNDKSSSTWETFITSKGGAIIEGPVTGEKLNKLQICAQMNTFRHPQNQLQALVRITSLPRGRVYIARLGNMIVGYVTFHLPDACSRWYGHPRVIEMGGIEVAKDWRCCHIGSALLKYIFGDQFWEDYIVIGFESFRYWDLQSNNLSVWEYRNMMDKFVGQANFAPRFTTMCDVLEHPANALVVRCGIHVSMQDWVLFRHISTSPVHN